MKYPLLKNDNSLYKCFSKLFCFCNSGSFFSLLVCLFVHSFVHFFICSGYCSVCSYNPLFIQLSILSIMGTVNSPQSVCNWLYLSDMKIGYISNLKLFPVLKCPVSFAHFTSFWIFCVNFLLDFLFEHGSALTMVVRNSTTIQCFEFHI